MTNLGATVKNLEVQIEVNPREHCNAITLRSGKPVEERKLREVWPTYLEAPTTIPVEKPWAKGLTMPKFLKEVMSKKRKLEEFETVKLIEECSAILQKKLPHKLKDPGSFNIPCNIIDIAFDRALCDLGATINLMPLSVFKKFDVGKVNPTTLTLQLMDRAITYPKGIIEDMLVKVDKFIFPVDFVVLDMEEDEKVPLILSRPFLATRRALIDVQEGKLMLRVNEEQVTFNIHQEKKAPGKGKVDTCKMIQSAEVIARNREKMELFYDLLVQYMEINYSTRDASTNGNDSEMKKAVDFILAQEADPPDKKKRVM
ncbi:uncharacterized protein LOC111379600 [Olea europaea var. sylvestris]|uniref:uncharacterized protein LOC111379600 n=1 Tax=Olea europaea var. sylvestris TaxID=158386 RepID=UPI000C1D1ECA|nr:uncharacterized protein LOC111379600 [Olea europaea var. sylvestris]